MKSTYTMSFAAACTHTPAHPERTARRNAGGSGDINFDIVFKVWASRAAMLTTIRMQEQREPQSRDWKACQVPEGVKV
jgi:hypothetical protein